MNANTNGIERNGDTAKRRSGIRANGFGRKWTVAHATTISYFHGASGRVQGRERARAHVGVVACMGECVYE